MYIGTKIYILNSLEVSLTEPKCRYIQSPVSIIMEPNLVSEVLKHLIDTKRVSDAVPAAFVINMDMIDALCSASINSFDKGFTDNNVSSLYQPSFSVKNVPFCDFLYKLKELQPRFKFECASIGEILISLKCSNINMKDIIFDSPCKTLNDIKYAVKNNISFNIDSLQELERVVHVHELLSSSSSRSSSSSSLTRSLGHFRWWFWFCWIAT